MPILNQLEANPEPTLCRSKANPRPTSCPDLPVQSQSGAKLCQSEANRMPILDRPGLIPKKAIFLFHFTTLSIHANPCESIPNFANPCQSNPIRANPCQSVPIHANLVPIRVILSSRQIANLGQCVPIQCQCANLRIFSSANSKAIHQSCTASLPLQVSQYLPRTYINATKLKMDWYSIGKGIPNSGQSGANFRPFT